MTDQAPEVETADEDQPPYFHDPEDDPEARRPPEHLEPEEDD